MKKCLMLTSLLAVSSLCLGSSIASAYPVNTEADFTCPAISDLSNFGNYIAGPGTEVILAQTNPIYFQSYDTYGVPADLSNYSNSAANYDSIWGVVLCSYTSSNADEVSFDIYYALTNGHGGLILAQTSSTVNVSLPIGLHS